MTKVAKAFAALALAASTLLVAGPATAEDKECETQVKENQKVLVCK